MVFTNNLSAAICVFASDFKTLIIGTELIANPIPCIGKEITSSDLFQFFRVQHLLIHTISPFSASCVVIIVFLYRLGTSIGYCIPCWDYRAKNYLVRLVE